MNNAPGKSAGGRVILFLGPPGVGKGTVATRIAAGDGFDYVSSGDLLRENVRAKNAIGREASGYMEAGQLVPDELVTRMALERLDRTGGQIILDGFPRTLAQARALHEYLAARGRELLVIDLEAPDEFLRERLANRIICRGCGRIYHRLNLPPRRADICDDCDGALYQREDDRPEVIMERLAVYHRQSSPVRDYFLARGAVHTIDGTGPLEKSLAAARAIIAAGGNP